jgi:hypothetical protein
VGASTTVDPRCTVSPILVPSCGAWLGASTPSADGRFDYEVGLREYEVVAKRAPDIQHFYKRGASPFPTPAEVALSERPGQTRSLLFYNWKPSTTLTWRQVADGGADVDIATVATSIAAYPHPLFLAVYHEPENDEGAAGTGMTAADFVDMYRHVVSRLRDLGATNAVFVMNYTGTARWAPAVDRFYPGDDVVDWIGYDPYALAEHTTFEQMLNAPQGDWPGFYEWATATAPGKPIMLAEFGFDAKAGDDVVASLSGAAEVLASDFPMLKALVYWNDSSNAGLHARLDQSDELERAFASFAADPYFALTSTSDAP